MISLKMNSLKCFLNMQDTSFRVYIDSNARTFLKNYGEEALLKLLRLECNEEDKIDLNGSIMIVKNIDNSYYEFKECDL